MKKSTFRLLVIAFWSFLLLVALYWPKFQSTEFEENSITIFTWGDIFDPDIIASFEKETGIKVHLNYYSSNEELLVKLKATKAEGYDLIVPSDYAVRLLIREELLQPLDKTKIHFWPDLNPLLLKHFYDPSNQYSLPFCWEIFGFGIDADYFAHRSFPESWKLIFDRNTIDYRIGMVNDPVEAVEFASYYLFGPSVEKTNAAQQAAITQLLRQQHDWVEVYASFRADYLLATKNCPVVIASSSYIWRTMRIVPFVRFIIPQEGTYITIENLCIPAASKKQSLIYRFLNHVYRTESSAAHFATYGYFPATIHTEAWPNVDPLAKKLIHATPEEFRKYHFLHDELMPEPVMRNLWVEVKTQ
jgi:spermidine/putrescine transport system substrate-binding protein